MKYSYSWLKELSGTKKSPEELAEVLALRAFETESVEKIKGDSGLEIKILADRGHDAMSHIGMAREICAIEGRQFKHLGAKLLSKKSGVLKVEIKDIKLCPRYIGVVMDNIKVGPSPMWVQARLKAAGIRPINNIVDATNYVMLETGQPMHAFDLKKLANNERMKGELVRIIVRRAKTGEKIRLLDETEKELTNEDLVIADNNHALALAGIMGGEDSGISENTTSIVLESANFNAANIRKSRMKLELKTESSDRFEKELDPNLAELAMARAVQIIDTLGGKAEGAVDIYPSKVRPWKIKLDLNYVNKLLGENISASAVKKILISLGLQVTGFGLQVTVVIPTFRLDLKTQEDLIEEIGRIYGYEKIQPQAPHVPVRMSEINEERKFDRLVKNILTGKGFSEVYNYSFYSQHDANMANLGDLEHLELSNPASPEQAWIRVSLIPGILKNVRENLKRYKEIFLFEIGKVYWPAFAETSADKSNSVLPEEKRMLVGAIHTERKINTKKMKQDTNFYEAKGYVDALLEMLGVDDYYFDSFESVPVDTPLSLWHESRTAAIKIEGREQAIGYIGEINPFVLANFDITKRVALFEIDLEEIQKITEKEMEYAPIRKYPDVMRDISMVSQGGILVDEILQAIQKAGGDLVLDVDLFDIYDFDDGSSSYAFHILFGAPDRTLESAEVDKLMEKIVGSLENELKLKVRK